MKKLTSLLALCLLVIIAKSQTPTLNTLIRFVNTPVNDLTEEVISIEGWELAKSEVVDSIVTLEFEYKDATLIIKKVKNHKNEVSLVCNKLKYDALNKSVLELKPELIKSEVDHNGDVVKIYSGKKYGYKISIQPKSLFIIHVYDQADALLSELEEIQLIKAASTHQEISQNSFSGETPMALRKFSNLVMPEHDGKKTGKIAVRIKLDKAGNVVDATPGVRGTTLNDRDLWQKCKAAIIIAKTSVSEISPDIQIGVVVFNFKVN